MKIVLYSTHCPKCNVLEKKLKAKGINFEEINDVEIMKSKQYWSVPVLEIDDTVMDFSAAINWINSI